MRDVDIFGIIVIVFMFTAFGFTMGVIVAFPKDNQVIVNIPEEKQEPRFTNGDSLYLDADGEVKMKVVDKEYMFNPKINRFEWLYFFGKGNEIFDSRFESHLITEVNNFE